MRAGLGTGITELRPSGREGDRIKLRITLCLRIDGISVGSLHTRILF